MKRTITILALSLALMSYGQTEQIDHSTFKLTNPYVTAKHSEMGGLEYVHIGFQNVKYNMITDIHSVMLSDQGDVSQFANDLRDAIIKAKSKRTIYWDENPEYIIYTYDFANSIYISDRGGLTGYTILTVNKAKKLLAWVDGVKLKE